MVLGLLRDDVMKILVVTGKLAEVTINEKIENLKYDIDVLPLPVTVASFITPEYAVKHLGKHDLTKYEKIIMPGTINGDLSLIEKATGVPTFKGPIHAADLPLIITENVQLSKTIPASILIQDKLREKALSDIKLTENMWQKVISEQGGFLIGNLPVSKGLPMRVMAEIVNAPTLNLDEISKKALYYESQGANIIDIGMLAENPKPDNIPKIINTLRDTVDLPLSIDSLNIDEIIASIDCGIDLILSLDQGNMDEVVSMISDEAIVVLPSNMSKGYLPATAVERVTNLSNIITKIQELGVEKIIGDLVVEPLLRPGLIEGLKAYQFFNQKNPEIPLLFGVGNAIELIDADSPGVHAALIALACEAGACMLHIPEYSVKAKGSVFEAVMASRMMFLAEKRGTVVKDLGLDLLILKEKRWKEQKYDQKIEEKTQVFESIGNSKYHPDKSGWFKIQIDRNERKIVVIHYPKGSREPGTIIKGEDSRTIYQTVIRKNLISKHNHAAYLGKELEKAAMALQLGRSYIQDEPLFNDPY
jgi:dihydropteroate synthase-like protein